MSSPALAPAPPTATCFMVSGPLDITTAQMREHYADRLAAAAAHPTNTFVLGCARGVDHHALHMLLALGVAPDRITVHVFTPHRGGRSTRDDAAAKFAQLGVRAVVADARTGREYASCTERDAAMTRASHADILWLRPEAETMALLGAKYRPGRVSGTQANKDRRDVAAASGAAAPSAAAAVAVAPLATAAAGRAASATSPPLQRAAAPALTPLQQALAARSGRSSDSGR